jgi:hypothetical protein
VCLRCGLVAPVQVSGHEGQPPLPVDAEAGIRIASACFKQEDSFLRLSVVTQLFSLRKIMRNIYIFILKNLAYTFVTDGLARGQSEHLCFRSRTL